MWRHVCDFSQQGHVCDLSHLSDSLFVSDLSFVPDYSFSVWRLPVRRWHLPPSVVPSRTVHDGCPIRVGCHGSEITVFDSTIIDSPAVFTSYVSCNGLAMDIVRNPKQTHSLGTSVGVAEEVVVSCCSFSIDCRRNRSSVIIFSVVVLTIEMQISEGSIS